ncbi:hypothetical protein F4818DRAFT_132762 [Hypoxylon cercidicola]|nr:hypothetical protein F4818DRAFT_132762 [Hypoxylon cercidicola]
MPRSVKDDIARLGIGVCLLPLIVLFFCHKYATEGATEIVYARAKLRRHIRVKTRRLSKSKPLAESPLSSKSPASKTPTSATVSFLHLPVEIRLRIYRLAFGDPAIAQVSVYSSYWGPRPENWGPTQGIRDDADDPSAALRRIIGLGGSGLRQMVAPPSHGCVHYGCVTQLICGDRRWLVPIPKQIYKGTSVFYTDLMPASRIIYGELLDVLYADNTISLFGPEIARYFCRNASPEGLRRVRFVHVALIIPSSGWDSRSQRKNIQGTIKMLRDSLHGLRQLDIEIVLLWGQPKDPQRFWAWLREDVLAQFRSLDRFVLKISVYKTFTPPQHSEYLKWTPEYEPLETWNESEYLELKARVTSLEETILP